jgi:DNA-binding NarL/FixJ family response regulator
METPRTHTSGRIVPGKEIAKTRILVGDEHPLLRHGVVAFINSQPDMIACGEADCISNIRAKLAETKPHLLVIGLRLAPAIAWNLSKGSRLKIQDC